MRFFRFLPMLLLLLSSSVSAQWTHFTNPDYIYKLALDGDTLWCCTSGGVLRYNTVDGSSRVYTTLDGLPDNELSRILVQDGNIWAVKRSAIYAFDGERFYPVYKDIDNPEHMWYCVIDLNGVFWGCTRYDIWRLDGNEWLNVTPDFFAELNSSFTDLLIDSENCLWFEHDKGVISFDGETWLTHEEGAGPDPDGNEQYDVYDFAIDRPNMRDFVVDKNGRAWMREMTGMEVGLFTSDGSVVEKISFAENILNNNVNAVAVDRNGTLWAGTFSDMYLCPGCPVNSGLSRFDGANWTSFTPDDGLAGGRINDIAVDSNNGLWISSNFYGISHYDGGIWTTYLADIDNDPMTSTWAKDICVESPNSVWVAVNREGLFHYDGENWEQFTEETCSFTGSITSLAVDHDGVLWVTSSAGFSSFDGEEWTLMKIDDIYPETSISSITIDSQDNKWFSLCPYVSSISDYEKGRLAKYDGKEWTIYGKDEGFVNNVVTTIVIDYNDIVWIGTYEGLSRFDGVTFKNWTKENGLPDEYVNDIAFGEDGAVWIGTRGGLCRYDPEADVFVEQRDKAAPSAISITGISPNPFNMATTIAFSCSMPGMTDVIIYNMAGQNVRTLYTGHLNAGQHRFTWNGLNDSGQVLGAGSYIAYVGTKQYHTSRKLLLMK